jgi:osmotically-inducible protein OsmY
MANTMLISEMFKFRFGSTIFCTDGAYGILDHLVVDPARCVVTQVGISRGLLLKKVVRLPFSAVVEASSDGIRLHVSSAQMATEAVGELAGVPLSARSAVTPAGAGHQGTLLLVAVRPSSGEITYIVAHHLRPGQDTLVRAESITELAQERVRLTLAEEDLKELPPYRSDSELQREAEGVLFDLYPLHVDMPGMSVRVLDGVLYLDGNISSQLRADLVERQMMGVTGLLEIKNNLIGDDTLASTIALRLGHDPRTRGLPIGVYPRLGVVRLSGAVRTAEQKRVAGEIVRSVEGVRAVINELTIDPEAARLAVMASTGAGDEDLVPGGRYVRHTR